MELGLCAAAAMVLAGCSEAKLAVPSELHGTTEALPITGMGIGERGGFSFAGGEGRFTRGAERLALFDEALVRQSGGGSFRFARGGTVLEGACHYAEKSVTVGIISATTRPFAYECRIGRDGSQIGELRIEEERGTTAAALGREARSGYVELDGVRLGITSIHRMAGGGIPTAAPLGYRFEEGGRAVGAVDLNGTTKTVHAPPTGRTREAVFAGSLALSVLWDPAL